MVGGGRPREASTAPLLPGTGTDWPTLPADSAGLFVQLAYDHLLGRGARAAEIAAGREIVAAGGPALQDWVQGLVRMAAEQAAQPADAAAAGPPTPCWVMGTDRQLTPAAWREMAAPVLAAAACPPASPMPHRYQVGPRPGLRVSALASLYEAGPYIGRFMENITTQEGFDELCELIIIDAASPHNEYATIAPYLNRHRNIRYIRCRERIGIYEAWNVGLEHARGEYVTNTNVDDLRRHDSFMVQAGVLDSLPFVDVVYQDFYYTLQPQLDFDRIAAVGVRSRLPPVTPHTEFASNPPHNAPMWRRRLHDELGGFDASYQSAGDYEFWLRCLGAGKRFFKVNDPQVAYFHNPAGMSTRAGTRGYEEARRATARHWRQVMPPAVAVSRESFVGRLQALQPGTPDAATDDRYLLVHGALRTAARTAKYGRLPTDG